MPSPNIVDAITAKLLATAAVTTLTGTRISGQRQDAWSLPTQAVLVDGPKGGPGEDGPGLLTERVDVTCYGSTGLNAKTLAAAVFDTLIPPAGERVSFLAGHVKVAIVRSEGGRIFLVDPDTKWPYVVLPMLFTYRRVYVP